MTRYLTFFVVLALALGVLVWVVKQAVTEQTLGASSDWELETLQQDINGL